MPPVNYLRVLYLGLHQHRVVSFVLVCQTQAADAAPVGAAVHLQQLVVSGTDRLLEPLVRRHQAVLLKSGGLVVRLDVDVAVRGQTNQARLDGFVLSADADVALHVVRFG